MSQPQKPTINNPVTLKGHKLPYFPIGDRVFVDRQTEEDIQTRAGIIIPGRSANALNYGVVLAAGPAALDVLYDAGIKIGDRVMWGRYAGDPLQWRNENAMHEIYVVNVKDIWGAAELCEAIAEGSMAIANVNENDSSKPTEHRFLRSVPEASDVERQPDGSFVGRAQVVPPAEWPSRENLEEELKRLQKDHRQAHMRQDVDTMEALQVQITDVKKTLRTLEAQD